MKLRDTTHSGQKVSIKPQELETMTSMMYNMYLQQDKQRNHLSLKFIIGEEEGERQDYIRDRPRNNDRQG